MQPWQAISKRLAALFCDYEPGIHYSQIQMQAGTSGINTIRIYNPVKNGKDKDPDGEWIRQWIPELSKVPNTYIHEPHLWEEFSRLDYPKPLVDIESANRHAREVLWATKKNTAKELKKQIFQKHGSRSFKRLKSSPKKFKATDAKQLTI